MASLIEGQSFVRSTTFESLFIGGKVDAQVLADQGADTNLFL